jgi:polyhydroxyalkanoate synthesis regulator protein
MIKTWEERCVEHPDHQSGMVSYAMIQARMQEEIDELRAAVFDPDWDRVKALEESLREHMAEIQRLKALAQPEPIISPEIKPDKAAAQEIERLRAALRYEENRFSRIGTHGPDCWKWGPGHYECALRHIKSFE